MFRMSLETYRNEKARKDAEGDMRYSLYEKVTKHPAVLIEEINEMMRAEEREGG